MLPLVLLLMIKNLVHLYATPTAYQALPVTSSSSIAAHACWVTLNLQTHTLHLKLALRHISMKVSITKINRL